ncbi:DUF3426 domain-containing protein [Achromobacter pestifer]|uniref:Zinc finger/thioredoxin putative domain-containing protein n=1 Tax=Achromobacter pestifer TaxID=1353889 RepID=A0A6S7A1F9_9BURK|nr:DUF3426 domain-containing protein [Achromobacter pestifer]CAB3700944.1 hypothetical protein LMG3431_05410 [Achromobacter pestifer]
MALTTRCPQCGTSFKVVPDQLRVRNGLVRCGACSTVFDGRACLLPESGVPAAMPAAPNAAPPVMAPAAAAAAPVLATPVPIAPLAPAAIPEPPRQVAPPPVETPPPLSRPSAEPRQIAPWEDEPIAAHPIPAPVAPAVPPAVLRGRDDIRRRIEPEADLPEDQFDDEDDAEDDDNRRHGFVRQPVAEPVRVPAPRRETPVPPQPVVRNEPIVASRANEPAIDWDARRRAAGQAEPSFAAADPRDEEDERYSGDDDRDDPDHDHDPRIRDDDYDDEPDHDDAREPVLGDTRTRYSSATDVGRAPPEFLDQDRQERRGLFRKLWGYACLLGLIALGLQLLYAYRTDIANAVPVLRPVLETACQPLGCTVGYARRLERIAISSSSLQPPTGAAAIDDGRSRLVLNLVLRNRYDKPQHWPALVLDLTDLSDTVVVRKVLMPENYLTPEQLSGPFGPAGELKISVPIEVTGVQVNGYQLDKFFP